MNETQRRRALADVKEFFLRAGALAALLLVLFGVVFGLAIQPDDTMYPHLKPGDLLFYYRLPRSFAAGLQRKLRKVRELTDQMLRQWAEMHLGQRAVDQLHDGLAACGRLGTVFQ